MTRQPRGSRRGVLDAIVHQRASLAAALIVAVLLIGVFGAPVAAVLAGCGFALAALLVRACWSLPRAEVQVVRKPRPGRRSPA